MRYDSFIIWGNGIQYTKEIVSMIRNHSDFVIILMTWYDIQSEMLDFIKKIYECDVAPWAHLELKTKYLINSPKKIFFILVRNFNPQEEMVGDWDNEYPQCKTVGKLKLDIRSRFNPRGTDNCGPPLPPGVLHSHVIHATDYESQVDHELMVLGLEPLDYYRRYDKQSYCVPFHLELDKFDEVDIDIDDVRIDIIGKGLLSVEQTPYYKYLNGDKQEMFEYADKYIGFQLQEDHYPEALDKLNNNFKVDYINKLGQRCLPIVTKEDDYYRILDGGHRVAVMKNKGIEKVRCILTK